MAGAGGLRPCRRCAQILEPEPIVLQRIASGDRPNDSASGRDIKFARRDHESVHNEAMTETVVS